MLQKRNLTFCACLFVFFIHSIEAADTKNLENRIKELESENFRLRQEGAMEAEAAKLLGQKLLKAYEEKVVIENELKEAKDKIKDLEEELAGVRKLMEKEVLSYRKKIGAVQEELDKLTKKKERAYLEDLEKTNRALKEQLSQKEEEIAKNLSRSSTTDSAESGESGSEETGSKQAGTIVSLSKEFNFVIIEFDNPGELTVGKIFSVFRGENKIGEVEISKIRDKYVFAKILNMVANEKIKEGDSIK